MVSVAFVPSDAHRAELENHVAEHCSQTMSFAEELVPIKVDPAGEISSCDNVQPIEVGSAVSRTRTANHNAEKFMPVRKFSCENYESFEFVANLGQIMDMPYPW